MDNANEKLLSNIRTIVREELGTMPSDVKSLQGDVKVLQGDVKVLQGDVKALQGDMKVMQGDMKVMQGDIKAIDRRFDQVDEKFKQVDKRLDENYKIAHRSGVLLEKLTSDVQQIAEGVIDARQFKKKVENHDDRITDLEWRVDMHEKFIKKTA